MGHTNERNGVHFGRVSRQKERSVPRAKTAVSIFGTSRNRPPVQLDRKLEERWKEKLWLLVEKCKSEIVLVCAGGTEKRGRKYCSSEGLEDRIV